jgi:hypothetical protein
MYFSNQAPYQLLMKKILKQCSAGHKFYKTSDCPSCPVCEKERRPTEGFLASLSAPARRALENKCIKTLEHLSGFTEEEILALHGIGPSSLPKLKQALNNHHFSFRKSRSK